MKHITSTLIGTLIAVVSVLSLSGCVMGDESDDTAGYQAPAQPNSTPAPRRDITVPTEDYRDTAEGIVANGKSSLRETAEINGVDTAKVEKHGRKIATKTRESAPGIIADARELVGDTISDQAADQAQSLIQEMLQ